MNISVESLTRAFYEADPGNTSCVPNELFDEYRREAHAVMRDIDRGVGAVDAIASTLMVFFEHSGARSYEGAKLVLERLKAQIALNGRIGDLCPGPRPTDEDASPVR